MTHTLVPKEPTEAMLREGAAQIRNFMDEKCPYPRVRAMWKAMLSAAPEPDAIKALVEAANSAPHHDECDLFVLGTECSCYNRRIDAALRPFLKGGE